MKVEKWNVILCCCCCCCWGEPTHKLINNHRPNKLKWHLNNPFVLLLDDVCWCFLNPNFWLVFFVWCTRRKYQTKDISVSSFTTSHWLLAGCSQSYWQFLIGEPFSLYKRDLNNKKTKKKHKLNEGETW